MRSSSGPPCWSPHAPAWPCPASLTAGWRPAMRLATFSAATSARCPSSWSVGMMAVSIRMICSSESLPLRSASCDSMAASRSTCDREVSGCFSISCAGTAAPAGRCARSMVRAISVNRASSHLRSLSGSAAGAGTRAATRARSSSCTATCADRAASPIS